MPFSVSPLLTAHPPLPAALLLAASLLGAPALAQEETFLLEPGSRVGPATRVVPMNCVKDTSGTVRCDTRLVNPEGDTPARPTYNPFPN